MEVFRSPMIGFDSPKSEEDENRHRIMVGDAKESHHIGWFDERGFYTRSSEGKLVAVSMSQLLVIIDNIDLLRLIRMEKETDQNCND